MRNRLDLSDDAWRGLVAMARSCNYYRVAPFLHACASENLEWLDARPAEIRDATLPEEPSIWYDGSPRYSRTLGELPATYLITVALSHGVESHARQAVSLKGRSLARAVRVMHRRESDWQILGAVLEAIGLGYLKPAKLISSRDTPKYRKKVLDKLDVIM